MAWSDPGDFTSGQILTAAQMDAVRESMFFGQATFTNEAARDAAIPAAGITLQEGMRAYLTAPTAPAATGGSTFVPTGVTTIYNGSVWVCVTPVGAVTNNAGSTTSTSFTATLTGSPGTNPSVTLVTGTTALIFIGGNLYTNNAAAAARMSFAVSGATTRAAVGEESIDKVGTTGSNFGNVIVVSGLTAGTNTFTLNYLAGSNTASFESRRITVQGIA